MTYEKPVIATSVEDQLTKTLERIAYIRHALKHIQTTKVLRDCGMETAEGYLIRAYLEQEPHLRARAIEMALWDLDDCQAALRICIQNLQEQK